LHHTNFNTINYGTKRGKRQDNQAWRDAGQLGIFLITINITLILVMSAVNHWPFP
jgi:hypothetical protein